MKRLHLIRHAKSSWDHPDLHDIERPLNSRGLKATKVMAPAIVAAGCSFDAVFCSAAVRAQETIENIASHLPDHGIKRVVDDALYTFSAGAVLDFLNALPENFDDVTIVGHNPAFTDLTNRLTSAAIVNVPTCGYVQMEFEGAWKDLDYGTATLNEFLTPKMVKGEK